LAQGRWERLYLGSLGSVTNFSDLA
jgi:hypothetical protein